MLPCLVKGHRGSRVSEAVFFENKYLTIPTVTPEAAVMKAAEDLNTTTKGNIPQSLQTKEGIKQLTKIFRGYAIKPTGPTTRDNTI